MNSKVNYDGDASVTLGLEVKYQPATIEGGGTHVGGLCCGEPLSRKVQVPGSYLALVRGRPNHDRPNRAELLRGGGGAKSTVAAPDCCGTHTGPARAG